MKHYNCSASLFCPAITDVCIGYPPYGTEWFWILYVSSIVWKKDKSNPFMTKTFSQKIWIIKFSNYIKISVQANRSIIIDYDYWEAKLFYTNSLTCNL